MAKDSRTLYQFIQSIRETADPEAKIAFKVLFDIYDEETRSASPGRPRVRITAADLQKTIRLNESMGLTNAQAAKALGVSERTYYRMKLRTNLG